MIKNCLVCNKEFYTKPSRVKNGRGKYCSKKCSNPKTLFKKGIIPINKNIPHTLETKIKMSLAKKGKPSPRKNKHFPQFANEKNPNWVGDKIGYGGVHHWIYKTLGKANKCENPSCVYPRKKVDKKEIMLYPKRYEWANVSHEYKRDINDWIQLCVSCHRSYDIDYLDYLKYTYYTWLTLHL